jgi:hypothetical protein
MERPVVDRVEPARGAVRVTVAREQHHLKKDDARVPHHRRAAKHGQQHLGDHRLDEKHQERAEKQRGAEERQDDGRGHTKRPGVGDARGNTVWNHCAIGVQSIYRGAIQFRRISDVRSRELCDRTVRRITGSIRRT